MTSYPQIHIALPVLNEFENLPALFNALSEQSEHRFHLWVCVNNYENLRNSESAFPVVENNEKSLQWLKQQDGMAITVIDKASKGNGWVDGKGGVGWARKTIMDAITAVAHDKDLIVSMDADTYYPKDYLAEIKATFLAYPNALGLTVPYYHQLADDSTDRLILRYEIYMRHFLLQLIRIGNPYAFTAIGSAMAFPAWAYRKVGGLTPVVSGEDFYFIQKLRKSGVVLPWCNTLAYPSPRFSDRVIFGTGPALIKGNQEDWSSYPVYHPEAFDQVKKTFSLFPDLYDSDVATPLDDFFLQRFKDKYWYYPLRKNYRSQDQFVKACINKVDGLRILQFLREKQPDFQLTDEAVLSETYAHQWPDLFDFGQNEQEQKWNLGKSSVEELNALRNALFNEENRLRMQQLLNCL